LKKILLYIGGAVFVIWTAVFIADIFDWPPQPITKHDAAIISRAIELIHDESVWDKKDNRQCSNEKPKLSLYCALRKASFDVAGEFQHESAAMEEVRGVILELNPNTKFSHILMDFNNDPYVSMSEIHFLLKKVRANLKLKWKRK